MKHGAGGGVGFFVRSCEGDFDGAGGWAEDLKAIVEGVAASDLLGPEAGVRVIDFNEADGGAGLIGDGGFDVGRMTGEESEAEEQGGCGCCESIGQHRDSVEVIAVPHSSKIAIRRSS